MPPSPDTGVECFACVFDYACRGVIFFTSPYAVSVLLFRGTGWLLWQGAPAGRARVEIDCAEHPAGLAERRFRRVSCQGDLAAWPEGSGVAPGWRWPSLSDRDGRGAIVRVASAVRRWGRRPKYCHGSVMLDVDVCAGISNGLWPRGASLPMVHCQRRITRGSPRRAGLRRCRFYGRIPPTQAMPVFQAGRPPATGSFGCAPDYPVELDWRGPLADCWFQQWSGVVLSWVSDQYHASDEGLQ